MSTKRSRKKRSLPVGPLPPQVAWLDGISMNVTPLISRPQSFYRRVNYLLTVTCESHDSAESSTWHLVRSFNEFRFLRKRLVAALKRGHFCQAECPWLYTFLKSYFPTSHLVGSSSTRVMDRRRKTLTRSLATIRSFLISRANHVCPLVMQGVASKLLEFIVSEQKEFEHGCQGKVPVWLQQLLQRWHDGDFDVKCVTKSDTTPSNDSSIHKDICGVCDDTLVGHVQKRWKTDVGENLWVESFSTLSCGHRFHDECLIQKLNEEMKCPTCGHGEAMPT
ncbi:unnamed protein product [Peronospora destructor]|uniref:RING-type domain-containing protein n=1 Tax=Peronospora destructor TaxID=86335 RepID=A0AAV0T7U1_9STRA|nr:unnamed protein product [Peronospora destructor]